MCEYVFSIQGSGIKRTDSPRGGSVEGSINYLTCRFKFTGDEWAGTIKTAYFENENTKKKYSQILQEDNTCAVPWEVIADSGMIKVSVAGERDGFRITSGIESFYNGKSICDGEPSEPPTPDQYDQMIAIAQSIRDDADAGEFDGKDGATPAIGENGNWYIDGEDTGKPSRGEKGEPGKDGKPGEKGDPGQNATDEQVSAAVAAYMGDNPIPTAITETASGKHIVVTDSADRPAQDLSMHGWTEQVTTTGANLWYGTTGTYNGVDVTCDTEGIFHLNGTCTGSINVIQTVSIENGAYTLYSLSSGIFPSNDNVKLSAGPLTIANNMNETNVTGVIGGKIDLRIRLEEDHVYNECTLKVMFNAGSAALPWEPYTGGKPSPSPDYPQEIVSAGEYDEETDKYEYEIKVTGKNILSIPDITPDTPERTIACNIARDITISAQEYPFSISSNIWRIRVKYLDGTLVYFSDNDFPSPKTFYASKENPIIAITYRPTYITEGCYGGIQVEYGTEATAYQPFTEQAITLTSDRPLTEWDRLERRDGVWGWVMNSDSIVFDGSDDEIWAEHNPGTSKMCFRIDVENMLLTTGNALSDKYIVTTGSWVRETFYVVSDNLGDTKYFRPPNEEVTNVEEFVDFLRENPVHILYRTKTEEFVPLSEQEQSTLNALCTYYPATAISNDQGCEMEVVYIADTKTYIDKQFAALKEEIIATQAQLL